MRAEIRLSVTVADSYDLATVNAWLLGALEHSEPGPAITEIVLEDVTT